jgi:hypothetical protein
MLLWDLWDCSELLKIETVWLNKIIMRRSPYINHHIDKKISLYKASDRQLDSYAQKTVTMILNCYDIWILILLINANNTLVRPQETSRTVTTTCKEELSHYNDIRKYYNVLKERYNILTALTDQFLCSDKPI